MVFDVWIRDGELLELRLQRILRVELVRGLQVLRELIVEVEVEMLVDRVELA